MTPLKFDRTAQTLIAKRLRRKPQAALHLDLAPVYSPMFPSLAPALRWTTCGRALTRDTVQVSGPHGVPLLIDRRLYRYLAWHPITVCGERLGPIARLFLAVDPLFVEQMRRWEWQHPAIAVPAHAAA